MLATKYFQTMKRYDKIFSRLVLMVQIDNTTRNARVKIIDYELSQKPKSLKKFSGRFFS